MILHQENPFTCIIFSLGLCLGYNIIHKVSVGLYSQTGRISLLQTNKLCYICNLSFDVSRLLHVSGICIAVFLPPLWRKNNLSLGLWMRQLAGEDWQKHAKVEC